MSHATFAEIAALAGDPARAAMLNALMDGRALTAKELAHVSGITPQTASGHLARLVEGELLAVEKQGRHRYHRLASPTVARMIEGIMQAAASRTDPARPRMVTGPKDAALRAARTCYDHLAGRLGVALADALSGSGYIELGSDGGLITESGFLLLDRLGIHVLGIHVGAGRRVLCRPCLDWSERRPHLAGAVGTALCSHSFSAGWIRRIDGTRAVAITPKGQRVFRDEFKLELR